MSEVNAIATMALTKVMEIAPQVAVLQQQLADLRRDAEMKVAAESAINKEQEDKLDGMQSTVDRLMGMIEGMGRDLSKAGVTINNVQSDSAQINQGENVKADQNG